MGTLWGDAGTGTEASSVTRGGDTVGTEPQQSLTPPPSPPNSCSLTQDGGAEAEQGGGQFTDAGPGVVTAPARGSGHRGGSAPPPPKGDSGMGGGTPLPVPPRRFYVSGCPRRVRGKGKKGEVTPLAPSPLAPGPPPRPPPRMPHSPPPRVGSLYKVPLKNEEAGIKDPTRACVCVRGGTRRRHWEGRREGTALGGGPAQPRPLRASGPALYVSDAMTHDAGDVALARRHASPRRKMAELDLLGSILSSMERPPAAADGETRRRARGQQGRGGRGGRGTDRARRGAARPGLSPSDPTPPAAPALTRGRAPRALPAPPPAPGARARSPD